MGALYSEFFPTGSTSGHPLAPPSQNAPAHDHAFSRALGLHRSRGLFPASGSFYPRHAICYCQPKPRRRVPCFQSAGERRGTAAGSATTVSKRAVSASLTPPPSHLRAVMSLRSSFVCSIVSQIREMDAPVPDLREKGRNGAAANRASHGGGLRASAGSFRTRRRWPCPHSAQSVGSLPVTR